MAEEACDVPQTVGLIPMNGIVIFGKRLLEEIGPEAVELCKALTNKPKELGVGLLLRAAFHQHRWQFVLLARRQVDLHELVNRFLEVQARLNRQVDGLAQIDKIGVRLILDFHLLLLLISFVF